MKKYLTPSVAMASLALLGFTSAHAQSIWTGATSDVWGNAGNWDGPTPRSVGTHHAVFQGEPTANVPTHNENISGSLSITFETAGWTILNPNGNTANFTDATITSNGAGVNRVYTNAASLTRTAIQIGAGNTLHWSGTWGARGAKTYTGSGTFVYDGPSSVTSSSTTFLDDNWNINGVNMVFNSAVRAGGVDGFVVSNSMVAGHAGFFIRRGTSFQFNANAVLAPGGFNGYGDEIGSIFFTAGAGGTSGVTTVNFNSGSSWAIQIGDQVGLNDQIVFDLFEEASPNNQAIIHDGVTLALFGNMIQDGTYVIANVISGGNIVGEFETVTFNGQEINPENFTINYNGDSITIDVVGIIPEPGTYALLLGGVGLLLSILRRRRR